MEQKVSHGPQARAFYGKAEDMHVGDLLSLWWWDLLLELHQIRQDCKVTEDLNGPTDFNFPSVKRGTDQ